LAWLTGLNVAVGRKRLSRALAHPMIEESEAVILCRRKAPSGAIRAVPIDSYYSPRSDPHMKKPGCEPGVFDNQGALTLQSLCKRGNHVYRR
jgi:hypothetical protein